MPSPSILFAFWVRLFAAVFVASFGSAALFGADARADYEPDWETLIGGYGVEEPGKLPAFGVAIAELFGGRRLAVPVAGKNPAGTTETAAKAAKKQGNLRESKSVPDQQARRPLDTESLRTTIVIKDWTNPDNTPILPGPPKIQASPVAERDAGADAGTTLARMEPAAGSPSALAPGISGEKSPKLAGSEARQAGRAAPEVASKLAARPAKPVKTRAPAHLLSSFAGHWSAGDCGMRSWHAIPAGNNAFRVLQMAAGRVIREDRAIVRVANTWATQSPATGNAAMPAEIHWTRGAVAAGNAARPRISGPHGETATEFVGTTGPDHYTVVGRGRSGAFAPYTARRCPG